MIKFLSFVFSDNPIKTSVDFRGVYFYFIFFTINIEIQFKFEMMFFFKFLIVLFNMQKFSSCNLKHTIIIIIIIIVITDDFITVFPLKSI